MYCHLELRFIVVTRLTLIQAKQKALHTIDELANFYNVVIWSDKESESNATAITAAASQVAGYLRLRVVCLQDILFVTSDKFEDIPHHLAKKAMGYH